MKKNSKKRGFPTSDEQFHKDFARDIKKALKAPKSELKIRVNTFIDYDIYESLQGEAERTGQKYQTLLNKYLRAAVLKEVNESDIKAIKIALGVK
jgi:uncharacterized protein (DUF4415 family)